MTDFSTCHDTTSFHTIWLSLAEIWWYNDLRWSRLNLNHNIRDHTDDKRLRLTERDWDKFIQHKMTLYRCMISDIHDSSYVLFSNNLISHTSLHVWRPLLRPFLVAYAEATLARQKKDSTTNEKCWHHFRIRIVDKWSVVWNECKNCEFLLTGWKSLWSLATWLVISDRYIGEVILQLSIEDKAGTLQVNQVDKIAVESLTKYIAMILVLWV